MQVGFLKEILNYNSIFSMVLFYLQPKDMEYYKLHTVHIIIRLMFSHLLLDSNFTFGPRLLFQTSKSGNKQFEFCL